MQIATPPSDLNSELPSFALRASLLYSQQLRPALELLKNVVRWKRSGWRRGKREVGEGYGKRCERGNCGRYVK